MNVESTPENLAKVAALIEALQTGKVGGTQVRQPVSVPELRQTLGVSRSTFYRWLGRSGKRQRLSDSRRFCRIAQSMPVDNNFEAIASKVLRIPMSRLQQYFDDKLTLEDLFKPYVETPAQEIVRRYRELTHRDQYVVLAQLLEQQAQSTSFKKSINLMHVPNLSHWGSASMPDNFNGTGAMCLRNFVNDRVKTVGGIDALIAALPIRNNEERIQSVRRWLLGEPIELDWVLLNAIALGLSTILGYEVTPQALADIADESDRTHTSC